MLRTILNLLKLHKIPFKVRDTDILLNTDDTATVKSLLHTIGFNSLPRSLSSGVVCKVIKFPYILKIVSDLDLDSNNTEIYHVLCDVSAICKDIYDCCTLNNIKLEHVIDLAGLCLKLHKTDFWQIKEFFKTRNYTYADLPKNIHGYKRVKLTKRDDLHNFTCNVDTDADFIYFNFQ